MSKNILQANKIGLPGFFFFLGIGRYRKVKKVAMQLDVVDLYDVMGETQNGI